MKQKNKLTLKAFFCLLLTLLCNAIYAQLSPFTLTATPTPQTCLGNGSLAFTTTGTTTGTSIDYAVYLLPNITTPVTIVTSPSANGLVAGNYKIIATQTQGNLSNTASAEAVIINNVVQLAYTLEANPCVNGGTITVNVTSGNAVSYEIIAGPLTKPLQTSNIFTNMPLGIYTVRVHDSCDDAVVVSVNMQPLPVSLYISPQILPDTELPDCNKIRVGHSITNNYPMSWPATLTFTIHPPTGGPVIIVTKTINNYSGDQIEYVDIPYYTTYYTYDVTLTDACGNATTIYSSVNEKFDFTLKSMNLSCNNFQLGIDMSTYKLPCTVSFLSAPAGFNPSSYNSSHPVFSQDNFSYGTNANSMPLGNYEVKVTDACGRTATHSITITDQVEPVVVSGIGNLSTCFGYFTISMPFGRNIVSAVITEAPDNYNAVLPHNVMQFVSGSQLAVQDIPAGNYTIVIIDECGVEHTIEIEIVASSSFFSLNSSMLPGCSENEGSIYLYSINHRIASLIITAAPAAYTNALPYDGSQFIDQFGVFRTNSLPEGAYTVMATDDCGNETNYSFNVEGYKVLEDTIEVKPGCGSFDILLNYITNSTSGFNDTYWLQQYNEETGKWVNPQSGNPYTEGESLYFGNALQLNNNTTNYTFAYSGKFRVMRYILIYKSQDPDEDYYFLEDCITPIYEFTYYDNPHINGAYGFTCGDGTSDVIIDAQGLAPLQYEITSKDGQPFSLYNGTSGFFQGLDNGIYTFRVTDSCNNFLNIQYDITTLQPFSISSSGMCVGQPASLSVAGFSFLQYEWWKDSAPEIILSTDNSLDFELVDAADVGSYSVHVTATIPGSCIDNIIHIEVAAEPLPDAGGDYTLSLCNNGQSLDLNQYLQEPYDSGGVWSDMDGTGKILGNMLITNGLQDGTYHFKYTVTNVCNTTDEAVITLTFKSSLQAPLIFSDGPACEGGSLQLTADTVEGALYSWAGPNGFVSNEQNPLIENVTTASAGLYTLTVVIQNSECSPEPVSVAVNVYEQPKFSINGDIMVCPNDPSVLSVIPENFNEDTAIYQWYFNDMLLDVVTHDITVGNHGTYKVIVQSNGCSFSKEVNLIQDADCGDISKGVSPNGDGFNDTFDLTNLNVESIKIFNRYGLMIYDAGNYKKEWHGQSNSGGEVPTGTYYYMITLSDGRQQTGWVYLQREE